MRPEDSITVDRREFLIKTGTAAAAFTFSLAGTKVAAPAPQKRAALQLPPLPFDPGALAPSISANTLSFHYGKHHQGYFNNTVKMIAGTEFERVPLEDIIRKTAGSAEQAVLFNNAAQVFNHTFYWNSMKPGGGGEPEGRIGDRIRTAFGTYPKFAEEFSNAAATQFGSGWAWLVLDGGQLKVMKTANADTPIARGIKPLLAIDVWEHAYYLDYQNRRADYIKAFVDKLMNWDFAEKNLGA
ncbi:MAG: superoxide dismutase [Acidobacteriia bacterium]|nr:superoxide dismutase [Terriglobia bacterium]